MNENLNRTALYCRLSKDDDIQGESLSIQSQKETLSFFANQNGWKIVETYIDDGYSGVNFERPAFQRMIADIEAGRIDIVMTKDLSRLGRDYLKAGYYTEDYFPSRHVRYIAVNDGVDTSSGADDIVPFKNILNEFYSRDISRKIRSTYLNKARKGEFTGCMAPLGYKKDPLNHNHLIIDEETEWIIRKIFAHARDGWGAQRIKTELERAKIPNPSWWNRQRGIRSYHTRFDTGEIEEGCCTWNLTTVKKILMQPAYIGSIASQKNICAFKLGWMGYRSPEEWIVVENTHEPIIDHETWDIVQQKINDRKRPGHNGEYSIFAGLLKCGTCGKTMTARYNSAREKHYSCLTYNRYGKEHCTQHRTNEKLIYDTVLAKIKNIARLAFEDKDTAIEKLLSQTQKLSDQESQAQNKGYLSAINRKKELDKMIGKLYQDWTSGALSEDNFKRILEQAQTEQKAHESIITSHTAVTQEANKNIAAAKNAISILGQYADVAELDAAILNELIDKIVIDEVKKLDGMAHQHMTIHFRFPYIETLQIR